MVIQVIQMKRSIVCIVFTAMLLCIFILPTVTTGMIGHKETYQTKELWKDQDIMQAIDDDCILSDNHIAILACFTNDMRPVRSWGYSVKRNILEKLCSLLKIEQDTVDYYQCVLSAAHFGPQIVLPESAIPYEKSKTYTGDVIIELYGHHYIQRSRTPYLASLPHVNHEPIYVPAPSVSKWYDDSSSDESSFMSNDDTSSTDSIDLYFSNESFDHILPNDKILLVLEQK